MCEIISLRFLGMPASAQEARKVKALHFVKVIRERSAFIIFVVLLLACQVFFVNTVAAEEGSVDTKTIERLERLIKAQQQQLESLQQQVNQMKQAADDAQTEGKEAKSLAEEKKTAVQAPVLAEEKKIVKAPADKVVTSGQERVKLSISGWVNRAVNVVDDGKDTEAYYVDNDNSESRVNFVGTAKVSDDLTLGSRIELTIAPNKAGSVDQNDQETGDVFEQRWTEVSLDSKRFGKLSLGKGFTASYGIASSDL